MNSIWKIIFFFILCIAAGLGIAYVISRMSSNPQPNNKKVVMDDVPSEQITTNEVHHVSPPIIGGVDGDGREPDGMVKPVKPKPYSCPVAPDSQPDQWLAPVGPDYDLGKDYIPNHLVVLGNYVVTSKPTLCLNASAAVRLQAIVAAMKKEGLHVVVSSAYRPASYQETLLEASEAARDKEKNPYPLVALAGHSEHQLGMAVDLVAKPDYTLDGFTTTPEYAWLQNHSYEYGFIQSYPVGSESITGYSTESWHYRYVGLANAKLIHDQGITTYQFLKNLAQEKTAL